MMNWVAYGQAVVPAGATIIATPSIMIEFYNLRA